MTTFQMTEKLYLTTKNVASGGGEVHVHQSSWVVMPLAFVDLRRSFDAEAAGRRAVRKHGEALRRLSD
jgi:hypothetical protein